MQPEGGREQSRGDVHTGGLVEDWAKSAVAEAFLLNAAAEKLEPHVNHEQKLLLIPHKTAIEQW